MTIITTAAQVKPVQQAHNSGGGRLWGLGGGSALAALLCFALPRRRRMLPLLVTTLLALSLLPSLGCGLGGSTPASTTTADPGTPLGTQIFTITTAGNDGVSTARHNYQYQVTIQ